VGLELNNCIRKISNGKVTTIAGTTIAGFRDGCATKAEFNGPRSVIFHFGIIYISDTLNNAIRILKDTIVSTFVLSKSLHSPQGIAMDHNNLLYNTMWEIKSRFFKRSILNS